MGLTPTFNKHQGLEPSPMGYYTHSSNDGYFSCEESLPIYQCDYTDPPHQPLREEMLETLIRGRLELRKSQRSMDEQLLAITNLATQIMQHFNPPQESHLRDSLDVVALRSGTKLQGPTMPYSTNPLFPENTKIPNEVKTTKEPLVTQEEAVASKRGTASKESPHFRYPIAVNKKWKAKTKDKRIVELLRKVEVPKYAKFLKEIYTHKIKIEELEVVQEEKTLSSMHGL
ncbi:hypothetical protein PIB30_065202 [Stylosanthes scabra]|uniref:Uncharacterized protein n=1 Tax=Stylosanthes scabra TaxID=79078 RepID=A0ABU6QLW2_9FABA|nr:hypothetical protein [Stylosanthes scabra]